jgi:hypothetical protein
MQGFQQYFWYAHCAAPQHFLRNRDIDPARNDSLSRKHADHLARAMVRRNNSILEMVDAPEKCCIPTKPSLRWY